MWSRPPAAHSLLAPHSVEDSTLLIAQDHSHRASLHVEQVMSKISVRLAPLPHVFRHAASLGRRTETPRRCADPGICLTHESRPGPWLDMEVVWGESVPRYHEAANIPRVGIRPSQCVKKCLTSA